MGDYPARAKALKEFQGLQKQLDDKIAERDKFMVSDDYEQDLITEYEFADDKRKKAILNELIELGQRKGNQNLGESPIFTPKPRKPSSKPVKTERSIDSSESYENEIFERTKRENANRQAEERKQDAINEDAKRIFDALLTDEVESQFAKPVQQQNQSFEETQQQTKQILENIKAQETKPQKIETSPPTSKKTYHFDSTPNERTSETSEGILKSLPTIHSKLKTDSHPNLKRFVDEQEKILRENPNDEDAKGEFQNILSRKFTDEDLQSFEDEAKPNEKVSEVEETPTQETPSKEKSKKKSESKIKSRPAGKSEKILTDSQKPVDTHYKVVSADELIPSHEWDGNAVFENKNYPADEKLQPRESRKGNAMTLNAIKRANNLNPELLTDSKNVNQGAPLVRNDGVVLNGNGRILSINRAYKNGKADGYKKHLIDNAEKFGLNAEEISKIENPVLIREVNQELTPELTSEIINSKTGGESFNDTELAREDAKKISFKPIKKYIEGGNSNDLLYDVANDVVPESERNKYFRDGGLTTSGLNRAKNTLFAKAYGEKGLLDDISNSGEEFSQNLQDALLESAPHIIQANKNRPNYRIGEIISDAAKKYVELKKKRKNVAAYIKEERETDSMFNPQRAAELDIIEEINDKVGNKNKLRSFFRDIANKIIAEENEKSGMFQSEEANKRVDEIVADAKKKSAESQGQSLFEIEGNPDTTITDDMLVDDKDLTSQQKTFTEISRELNFETKYFTGDPKFKGVLRKGTSYINVNNKNFEQTFYHEAAHYLSSFNPELFNEILESVPITKEQLQAVRDRSPLYENLSERQLKEEILADNFMDFSKRAGFLREVGKQNKSLAEKLVSWLKSLMDRFTGFFNTPKGGLTRTQRNAMYSAFKKNIDSIVDGNGNKIFRMSNATFEIQRANGEKLPPMDLQMFGENSVDRQEILTDNQKKDLFDTIKQHIDDYISEQTKSGKNQSEVAKELTAENSRHRARTLGALKATLRDFENRANDKQHRRITVERIHGKKNWSDAKVDEKYQTMTDNLREMVDYGGVLYHEIALHRAGTQGMSGKGVQLLSWADAERQRAEREGAIFKENGVDKKHSEKNQGAFSMDRYSIEREDGKIDKLLDWGRKIWKGKPREKRWRNEATKLFQRATGYKIAYRHFEGDDMVIVDDVAKLITVDEAYNFDELVPKISKIVAKKVGLPQTDKMQNYITEWVLRGTPTNSPQESQLFEKAMVENPVVYEKLSKAQQLFQDYADMSALDKYGSIIAYEKPNPNTQSFMDRMEEEIVDDTSPLGKLTKEIREKYGDEIADALDSQFAARMYRGGGGIIDLMTRAKNDKQVKDIREILTSENPFVNFEKFVPIEQIIKMAGGQEKLRRFDGYLVALQEKELHEINKRAGKEIYKTLKSEQECDKAIAEGKAEFDAAQKAFVNYANVLLDFSIDGGLISRKRADSIKKTWKNYAPTARVFDDATEINSDSFLPKQGSTRDVVSPIMTLINNTAKIVKAAQKNKIKINLKQLAVCEGFGKNISEVEAKNGNEPTITYKENGKTKYLATTAEVKRVIDSLDGDSTQGRFVTRAFQTLSSWVSNTYTILSADFSAGNIFRDTQEAYLYGEAQRKTLGGILKHHLLNNPIANFARVIKMLPHIWNQSALYLEWKAMGGSQATFVSPDMNRTQIRIDDLTKSRYEKFFKSGVGGFFEQCLTSLQKFSEFTEEATRLAVYKSAKDARAENREGGKATYGDMRKAAFASRNATIDFARGGSSMKKINKYFRFSNIAIQDMNKSWTVLKGLDPRNLATEEGRLKMLDTGLKLFFGAMLPTIAFWALNHDDDWYKHSTPQWQKDTSWILGKGVKIPKSLSLVGKIVSMATEEWLSDNPTSAKRIAQPILESLPSLLPTLLVPITEAMTNHSFFYGGALVPQKEQRLPSYKQYSRNTSELAKWFGDSAFAHLISKAIYDKDDGISPRKIDHILEGYLGFLGKGIEGVSNLVTPSRKISFESSEFPILKRFLFDPHKNPQIVADYYNKRSEQERFFNEYKQNRKEGRNEKPDGYDEKLYRRIKSAETAMKNISEKERKLIANSKIPADQLKKQLQELEERRIKLCKKVFGYS